MYGQSTETFKCDETPAVFSGTPEQTLCEEYSELVCAIEIGEGTPYDKSSSWGSSISGNVCIVGDLVIDEPFTFSDAVVRVAIGKSITINPTVSLSLDKSKFFACGDLWKGIIVGEFSIISTNDSEIEDAEQAIYANGPSALYINHTTFNRNRVGIELATPYPSIWSPGPLVWVFADNLFSCDAPLNGTTDELGFAGVKLKDAYLYTFQFGYNRFYDLENGIYAEGAATHIGANAFPCFPIPPGRISSSTTRQATRSGYL